MHKVPASWERLATISNAPAEQAHPGRTPFFPGSFSLSALRNGVFRLGQARGAAGDGTVRVSGVEEPSAILGRTYKGKPDAMQRTR